MFLTLQFPLFDQRNLSEVINRAPRPNWYNPEVTDKIRYMGMILDKNSGYIGPWDGERYYCNASGVINLCGLEAENYFKSLKDTPVESKVIFRRFQSDGHFMAKFEIGWTDHLEEIVAAEQVQSPNMLEKLREHLRSYLECQIKIKVGNQLSEYTRIGDAIDHLKNAYYWSTVTGPKSFAAKDLHYQVEGLNPMMIIHLDRTKMKLSDTGIKRVVIDDVTDQQLELYHDNVSFHGKNGKRYVDLWIITTSEPEISTPGGRLDYASFPPAIKNLRKNLLKVPVDTSVLRKLNALLIQPQGFEAIDNPMIQKRISVYLHKALIKLCEEKRNHQNQKSIVEIAMDGDQENGLLVELGRAIEWFKTLPVFKTNENMQVQIEARFAELLQRGENVKVPGQATRRIRIFLASSSELRDDRDDFEIFISRKNKDFLDQGIFLEIIRWENFIDAMSKTRLQEEYNKAVAGCDIFISLFHTKVGQFTEEEFDRALDTFLQQGKPRVYTFFKGEQVSLNDIPAADLISLLQFREKLKAKGHYPTHYNSNEDLKYQFGEQLTKILPELLRLV